VQQALFVVVRINIVCNRVSESDGRFAVSKHLMLMRGCMYLLIVFFCEFTSIVNCYHVGHISNRTCKSFLIHIIKIRLGVG
jgi:hypothetical protein